MDIYTDGNCTNNGFYPNIGGNGFVCVLDNELEHYFIDVVPNTTNNQMEIKGAINALLYLKQIGKTHVDLYTDSQYLANSMELWSEKRIANNWKTSKNSSKEVKNADLLKLLYSLKEETKTTFIWIRRDSSPWNTLVDYLIDEEIKKFY